MEFRNAKNECGLENVLVRSFQSIMNYLVCSLLGVRLLRMMESLLGDAGIAVPRLLERLRLALQGILYDSLAERRRHRRTRGGRNGPSRYSG